MPRIWVIALVGSLVGSMSPGAASAQDCFPHCDYTHDYGPYDFTYIRPGLYGYAFCARSGECAPYLAYSYSGYPRGRITIRTRVRPLVMHP
jgi:hypothetical protein